MGQEDIKTVQCDTSAQTCSVKVPAPGFALIFLTDTVYSEAETASTLTFPTTARTQTRNTGESFILFWFSTRLKHHPATVDPSVLATSNGERSPSDRLDGTSPGSEKLNAGGRLQAPVVLSAIIAGLALGARLVVR